MQDHYTPDDKSSCSIPSVPGIYKIICVPTGRFYVGSAIDLRNRWSTHLYRLRRNMHHNAKMQASWNKYGGEQSFIFEVLEYVMFAEMLIEREQHYIDTLSPFGKKGFNLAPVAGSRLGHKQSPEAIEKLRQASLGRKQSPEAIEKTRQAHLGRKRPPETGQRISAAKIGNPSKLKGREKSPEAIESHRRALTGYKHTEEAKLNMAKAQMGRKHSLESREKRSQSLMGHTPTHTKTFIVTAPDGTEYRVEDGLRGFCREHQLSSSTLVQVAKGNRTHHKGWTARYPDAEIS